MLRAVGLVLAVTLAVGPLSAQGTATRSQTTLYTRLGGYDGLARFVDTAFPRVAGTPALRRFFQGHSRDSQVRQRQLIIDALCLATGGPCAYIGRDLTTVHQGLGITGEDWVVFIGVIDGALKDLAVTPAARTELLALFEQRLRPTVVLR